MTSKSAAEVVAAKRSQGQIVIAEVLAAAIGVDGSAQYGQDIVKARHLVTSPPLRCDPTTSTYLLEQLGQ
jgi:hypothetical protein